MSKHRFFPYCGSLVCFFGAVGLFAAEFHWVGTASDGDWNNPGNWSPSAVPNPSDPAGDTVVFGDFGRNALTVVLRGKEPRNTMYIHDLKVTSAARADLTFAAINLSYLNTVTLQPGGTYQRVAIRTTAPHTLRMQTGSRIDAPTQWIIGDGKIFQVDANLGAASGPKRHLEKLGAGTVDYLGSSIGRATEENASNTLAITVSQGTWAFSQGVGRAVHFISADAPARQGSLTVRRGATLEMDIGPGGDRIDHLWATGNGSTDAFQQNWLTVERGAQLKLNLLRGYTPGTWHTLFRNVGKPAHDFTVLGLGPGQSAQFRHLEYSPGLFDYQVTILSSVGSASR